MTQDQPELVNYVGPDDLLSRALGAPEYGGRLRGTGFAVTQTSYFGYQKRPNKNDFMQLKEEICDYKQQLEQQMSGYKNQVDE